MNGDADEEIEPDASGTFFPIYEDWLIPTTQSSVPEDPRAPCSRKRSGPYLLSDEVHKMRYALFPNHDLSMCDRHGCWIRHKRNFSFHRVRTPLEKPWRRSIHRVRVYYCHFLPEN